MSDGTFISLVVDLKRGDRSGGEMEPHFFCLALLLISGVVEAN